MLCQRLVIYALTMTSYGHDLMEASTAIFFRSLLCTHEHYSMHAHHRFLPFFFPCPYHFVGISISTSPEQACSPSTRSFPGHFQTTFLVKTSLFSSSELAYPTLHESRDFDEHTSNVLVFAYLDDP